MTLHHFLSNLALLLSLASVVINTINLASLPPARWPSPEKLRTTRNRIRHRRIVYFQAKSRYNVTQLGDLLHNPHLQGRLLEKIAKSTPNPEVRVLVAQHPNATAAALHTLATGTLTAELRDTLIEHPSLQEGDLNFLLLDKLATPERSTARSFLSSILPEAQLMLV